MLVLITGASGFIGSRLAAAFAKEGHKVIGCTRNVPAAYARFPRQFWIKADFNHDIDARAWRSRLYHVDVVVNCAGILRETRENTFEAVHALGPCALFDACRRAGVKRVIQLSIAGTDSRARSHLIATRRYADSRLQSLDLDWTVLAAAPVFGRESPLSRAFLSLAHLPRLPLIDTHGARMAPVHIEDVTDAVVRLLKPAAPERTRVPLVGPEAMSLATYIARLRRTLGLREPRSFGLASIPAVTAHVMELANAGFPGHELIALARTDLSGDPAALTDLLGRPPRPVERFLDAMERRTDEVLHAA